MTLPSLDWRCIDPATRDDINPQCYATMIQDSDGHAIEAVYWDR
jgi:hypothetical protein